MKLNISGYERPLRAAVEASGWELAKSEELDAWWCHEAWQLRSIWAPHGFSVWVTFLIDPQASTEQLQRGEYRVWAVKASAELPTHWQDNDSELTVPLSGQWQGRLPELVGHLATLRDRSNKLNQQMR